MRNEEPSQPRLAVPPDGAANAAPGWAALTELLLTCSTALREELAARSQSAALSGPQFALLWACESGNGGLSQRELALRLSLSTAHVSGLVEQLGARGLIVGARAANDRRRQIWQLTPAGRDAVQNVIVELEPFAQRLNSQLSASTREQLDIVLRNLSTALLSRPRLHEMPAPNVTAMAGGAA